MMKAIESCHEAVHAMGCREWLTLNSVTRCATKLKHVFHAQRASRQIFALERELISKALSMPKLAAFRLCWRESLFSATIAHGLSVLLCPHSQTKSSEETGA